MKNASAERPSCAILRWFIPNATVFVASGCIMIVELTAGRLVSRYLGQSLYTWTSVIGVVLAGLSVGNYIGGRLADRFEPRGMLSMLFAVSSLTCLTVPALNHFMGRWEALWELTWPMRIFVHVFSTFILPSTMLGTIGPVVARMALSLRSEVGRTIGGVYAWGAAGSIAGTFLAGFWLIAAMGTTAVTLSVAGVLAALALLYGPRRWFSHFGMLAALAALAAAFAPGAAAARVGQFCYLREPDAPEILYRDESQYSYIAVKALDAEGRIRGLYLDKMMHSQVDMAEPTNLLYRYAWVYEAALDSFSEPGRPVSAFVIGGGAYTFPQYLIHVRPGSHVDVAEIDPAVTEAARRACGFREHPSVHIYHADARTFVADRVRALRAGDDVPRYAWVFGDTFNDYSVPFHLTTREFNDQLSELMTPDGLYLLNMIDHFDSGRFLAAVIRTCERTFPHVYVFYCHATLGARGTYVVVCSKLPRDVSAIVDRIRQRHAFQGQLLPEEDVSCLLGRTSAVVLTDDFAPVENLLAEVVRYDRPEGLDLHYLKKALAVLNRGELSRGLALLRKAADANPANPQVAYNMGVAHMQIGHVEEALAAFAVALEIDPSYAAARNNAGVLLARLGRTEEAAVQFGIALEQNPHDVDARLNLAGVLASLGRRSEAEEHLREVLALKPDYALAHNVMGELLAQEGRVDEALPFFERALYLDPHLAQARANLQKWGRGGGQRALP